MLENFRTIIIQPIPLIAHRKTIKRKMQQINRKHQHQSHRITAVYWLSLVVMVSKISVVRVQIHWAILLAVKTVRIIYFSGRSEEHKQFSSWTEITRFHKKIHKKQKSTYTYNNLNHCRQEIIVAGLQNAELFFPSKWYQWMLYSLNNISNTLTFVTHIFTIVCQNKWKRMLKQTVLSIFIKFWTVNLINLRYQKYDK